MIRSVSPKAFSCLLVALGFLAGENRSSAQPYLDNQTLFQNQDPTLETRRSDHFRVIFGHYNRDFSFGPTLEALAQGNLQMEEQMWQRWVVEDGLVDINHSVLSPNPMPGKYRANFLFLETQNDGGGGGSYNSMDGNGYFWAMDSPGLARFDPPSGASPHEWGDVWWGEAGGYNGNQVGGNIDECIGNYMMLQFMNNYPQAGSYIANGMYTPIHGRDYFDSWPIFEEIRDNPAYGYPFFNALFSVTNATPVQQQTEWFPTRMIRLDTSASPDHRGVMNDLWGDMAKRLVTWDFQRQPWLAQANGQNGQGSSDPGTAWNFYQRCRTPLVAMPGTNGWYRPSREHMPQEFGWNIIPLQATPGTTVTCNFQPQGDPIRQSDFRACLVAVSTNSVGGYNTNNYASYSTLWNAGANSITLSPDQTQLYLVVIATPKPNGSEIMSDWWAYLEEAGLQFPYALSFTNAAPLNVVEAPPSGVTWKSHTNPDGTVCQRIASTATVASTAYVSSNAMVIGSAQVNNSAQVLDYAVVRDHAVVSGNAVVSGHGEVRDYAQLSGFGKVRDWGRLFGYAQVSGYGKVIEHGNCGDGSSGAGNYTTVSGSAIIKGTTYVYAPSYFNGCIIMDGDSADGNGTTTPASYGVHFGWQWGDNSTAWWSALTNNNYQYCGLTFENTKFTQNGKQYGISNNPVFALDQYGINHGFLMNGCQAAVDTGTSKRGGYVLPLNGTNQYVELHNSVNDFNDTTIAVWFKNTGGSSGQQIWSMGDGTNKVMYLTPNDPATGNLRFMITDGKTTNYLNGSAVPMNVWTHVAVVFAQAASNSVLYVNGLPVATNLNITLFPDSLNAPLMANADYLGRGNNPTNNFFQGSVDDFRVFMRSFAASDVLALYNKPAPAAVTPVADPNPPTPNPATWLVNPTAISDSAITMSATPGVNPVTGWVEYYFACTSGGGHDSGWLAANKYTDCNLTPGTTYSYTVSMKNELGVTTTASSSAGATTLVSSAGSASFAYGPVGIANGQITMVATVLTNASGKTEYKFDRSGKSSGWQAAPAWTDIGLSTGSPYNYTVTVRDGRGNTSAPVAGSQAFAKDQAAPLLPSFLQADWVMEPYPTLTNTLSMTAQTATDPSGVQYYFHCTSSNAPDSGWRNSPTYVTSVLADGAYSFQYMLRDTSAQFNTNQTPSTIYTGTINPTTGYHVCTLSQVLTNEDDALVSFPATVLHVNASNYSVEDLASGATITVEPNTSNLVTYASLNLKNITVQGHLYTRSGSRIVTYSAITSNGVPALYNVSGRVTNIITGATVPGATVYFSYVPGATSNAVLTTTTGASGTYTNGLLPGTWYVATGAGAYNSSADSVVVVGNAGVPGVNFGLVPNAVVSGLVTRQSDGTPVAGATVYFSQTPSASGSPAFAATTAADGTYAQAVQNGVWYVAAGGTGYYVSPDLTVTLAGVNVSNINFALKGSTRNIPQTGQLLFSVVTESLPAAGQPTGNWLTYNPSGLPFVPISGTPTVQSIGGQKWEQNASAASTGFRLENPAVNNNGQNGQYANPVHLGSGATVVLAARPTRNGTSPAWDSIVDVFFNQLALGIMNGSGQIVVGVNDNTGPNNTQPNNIYFGPAIPSGQMTIISLVVANSGVFTVYTNGMACWTATASLPNTGAYTQLTPGARTGGNVNSFASYINIGREDPDGWSAYNGYIGDVFVYTNALATADRQTLEADLMSKFFATGNQITASANAGGTLNPSGTVNVAPGVTQVFSITPAAGSVVSNVVVDGVSLGAVSSYTFTNVVANHAINVTFASVPVVPPTLSIAFNGTGGIDITWPDTYTGRLMMTPVIGPGATWTPVGGTPDHVSGLYKFTVTLGTSNAFYGLSQ